MGFWNVESDGGVVVASYENPPMNYFCADGTRELAEHVVAWRDPSVRAVVLTGALEGRFITHYSVEELHALASDREQLRKLGVGLVRGYHELLGALRDLPKPVIAALNGDTMGGGFELSLACDIRIGARGDHRFGLPEARLGILPGGSGTQRLARLLGAGRAIAFILRGRVVRPEQALELGLVHELADDAGARAREVAGELAALAPRALAEIKRAVYAGSDTRLEAGLEIEAAAFLETMKSEDAVRAMAAYLDVPLESRRDWLERGTPPVYTGS